MFSETEIIFESDEHHALYCALFPENAPSAKTVSTVLVAQGCLQGHGGGVACPNTSAEYIG